MADDPTDDNGETGTGSATRADETARRRIRTMAIFFIGIGVYASVGAGLDSASLLIENLTTYFVSGGVVFAIGVVLLLLAR